VEVLAFAPLGITRRPLVLESVTISWARSSERLVGKRRYPPDAIRNRKARLGLAFSGVVQSVKCEGFLPTQINSPCIGLPTKVLLL